MKLKIKEFKWNEIISLFEHAKHLGIQPTLIITYASLGQYHHMWVSVQLRDCKLMSRIYDESWLAPRIKEYINQNKKCPYGDIIISNR